MGGTKRKAHKKSGSASMRRKSNSKPGSQSVSGSSSMQSLASAAVESDDLQRSPVASEEGEDGGHAQTEVQKSYSANSKPAYVSTSPWLKKAAPVAAAAETVSEEEVHLAREERKQVEHETRAATTKEEAAENREETGPRSTEASQAASLVEESVASDPSEASRPGSFAEESVASLASAEPLSRIFSHESVSSIAFEGNSNGGVETGLQAHSTEVDVQSAATVNTSRDAEDAEPTSVAGEIETVPRPMTGYAEAEGVSASASKVAQEHSDAGVESADDAERASMQSPLSGVSNASASPQMSETRATTSSPQRRAHFGVGGEFVEELEWEEAAERVSSGRSGDDQAGDHASSSEAQQRAEPGTDESAHVEIGDGGGRSRSSTASFLSSREDLAVEADASQQAPNSGPPLGRPLENEPPIAFKQPPVSGPPTGNEPSIHSSEPLNSNAGLSAAPLFGPTASPKKGSARPPAARAAAAPLPRRSRVPTAEWKKSVLRASNERLADTPREQISSPSPSPSRSPARPQVQSPRGTAGGSPSSPHKYNLGDELMQTKAFLFDARAQLDELHGDVRSLEEALQRTTIHLQDERTLRHAAERQCEALQAKLGALRDDMRVHDREIMDLREELTRMRTENNKLLAGPARPPLDKSAAALQREVEDLEKLIRGYQTENEKLVESVKLLKLHARESEAQGIERLAAMQRELSTLKSFPTQSSAKEAGLRMDNEQLRARLLDLEATEMHTQVEYAQLERRLEATQAEARARDAATAVALQEIEARLRAKEDEVANLLLERQKSGSLENKLGSHSQLEKKAGSQSQLEKKAGSQSQLNVTRERKSMEIERLREAERAKERDAALDKRDAALTKREGALAQRDAAVTQRDAAVVQRESSLIAREAALAKREDAVLSRDSALAEREASLKARELDVSGRAEKLGAERAGFQAAEAREMQTLRASRDDLQEAVAGGERALRARAEKVEALGAVLADREAELQRLRAQLAEAHQAREQLAASDPREGTITELRARTAQLEQQLAISDARSIAVHETTISLLQKSSETVSRTALAHSEQALRWLKDHDRSERGRFEEEELARYRQRAQEAELGEREAKARVNLMERELAKWRVAIADLGLIVADGDEGQDADSAAAAAAAELPAVGRQPFDAMGIRVKIERLKRDNAALEEALNVARSAHTPTMRHYEQLLGKFEKLEAMYQRKERAVREMMLAYGGGSGIPPDSAVAWEVERTRLGEVAEEWRLKCEAKEAQLTELRGELDEVIGALEQYSRAQSQAQPQRVN